MSKFKVLIVDDAGLIRDLIRKGLRMKFPNWQISEEINGAKARQLLKKSQFDLILCDWEMPEMNGAELLTWFRKEHQNATPFIMVTSRGDKEHVVEAIQAGVSNYLVKPFNNQQLIEKVTNTLKKAGVKIDAQQRVESSPMNSSVSALTGGGSQGANRAKPASHASGSIDVLTGGSRSTPNKPNPQKRSGTSVKPAPTSSASATKKLESCQLRLGSGASSDGLIQKATLQAINVLIPYREDEALPALLEPAVVDLEVAPGQIARINGFILGLEATKASMTPDAIKVNFHIVDDDGDKMAQLSKFIAKR